MTVTQPSSVPDAAPLHEPAHQVSPRAVRYWALQGFLGAVVVWAILFAVYWFVPDGVKQWLGPVFVAILVYTVVEQALEPLIRYRRTRWEVTGERVFAQTGWLSRDQRIAPLSRVQTVDTERGPLMRIFRLANVTVTTASAAGPIRLTCLDTDVADRVTAELARVTGQTRGDAT